MLTGNKVAVDLLRLRVGDLVEVRSPDEILRTLDANGTLNFLPFMPEMLKFTGKRYRVFKRIDKVCGNFEDTGYIFRRMEDTVLLEGLRCDGEAHGGCQAACMLQWKGAWLKPVDSATESKLSCDVSRVADVAARSLRPPASQCNGDSLLKMTQKPGGSEGCDDEIFVCQLTESKKASSHLSWWDPRPYWRDIRSGNVGVWQCIRGMLIMLFNAFQRLRNRVTYPYFEPGKLKKTPSDTLNLRAGEMVEVKSRDEISQTLDWLNRNRGLWFDVEMLKYCGRRFKVRTPVRKVINEKTGKMLNFSTPSIILEGAVCSGNCHQFCPRSEYIFWREIWVRRAT